MLEASMIKKNLVKSNRSRFQSENVSDLLVHLLGLDYKMMGTFLSFYKYGLPSSLPSTIIR